eukprot:scaffold140976_cov13-Tisochrysis_lutea.AAC.2
MPWNSSTGASSTHPCLVELGSLARISNADPVFLAAASKPEPTDCRLECASDLLAHVHARVYNTHMLPRAHTHTTRRRLCQSRGAHPPGLCGPLRALQTPHAVCARSCT